MNQKQRAEAVERVEPHYSGCKSASSLFIRSIINYKMTRKIFQDQLLSFIHLFQM